MNKYSIMGYITAEHKILYSQFSYKSRATAQNKADKLNKNSRREVFRVVLL